MFAESQRKLRELQSLFEKSAEDIATTSKQISQPVDLPPDAPHMTAKIAGSFVVTQICSPLKDPSSAKEGFVLDTSGSAFLKQLNRQIGELLVGNRPNKAENEQIPFVLNFSATTSQMSDVQRPQAAQRTNAQVAPPPTTAAPSPANVEPQRRGREPARSPVRRLEFLEGSKSPAITFSLPLQQRPDPSADILSSGSHAPASERSLPLPFPIQSPTDLARPMSHHLPNFSSGPHHVEINRFIFSKTLVKCPPEFSLDAFKQICLRTDGQLVRTPGLFVSAMTSLTYEFTKRLVIILSFVAHRGSLTGVKEVISTPKGVTVIAKPTSLPEVFAGQNTQEMTVSPSPLELSELPSLEITHGGGRLFTPLPATLNKFCEFRIIDRNHFKMGWIASRKTAPLLTTEAFETNKKVLSTPQDLLNFLPTLCNLYEGSPKAPSFHKSAYKFGGVFLLQGNEFRIRFRAEHTGRLVIELLPSTDRPSPEVISVGEALMQTMIFLLAQT
eukprot:TRINITY_DN2178_c0_g1_i3.p1 TRINITY_DN2178_c0_g1~~TRINITY_DN2178_c0_g1_i3.p1  ORF type:complete len:500 (+),score=76.70 TRINITY_DN2178_c0_g1_i3:199-1698(+)